MNNPYRSSRAILLAAFCLLAAVGAWPQSKYALLVGIDVYSPQDHPIRPPELPPASDKFYDPGGSRWDLPTWPNLAGAVNDVKSMQALLTSRKFAFPNDAAHLHVLTNAQATRAAVLDAMQKYLVDQPARGDTVVFYYAGRATALVGRQGNQVEPRVEYYLLPVDALPGALAETGWSLDRAVDACAKQRIQVVCWLATNEPSALQSHQLSGSPCPR